MNNNESPARPYDAAAEVRRLCGRYEGRIAELESAREADAARTRLLEDSLERARGSLDPGDAAFLAELRRELTTQDTVGQADPRFWVVKDSETVPCMPDEADEFVLLEDGEAIGILDEYRDDLPGGLQCVPRCRRGRINKDTLFLTLRECGEHIRRNHYHYADDAHPYAMTAWRSPQVERLWKILQETDWESLSGAGQAEGDE